MSRTALVILNFNGKKYLEQFLPSVLQFSPPDVRVVVGDNQSTDDSLPFLKSHFPSVAIIENERNYGFARGYNEVLKQIPADYYFLLNSDVQLRGPWMNLVTAMNEDPDLAACQPKILSFKDPEYFEHAGAAGGWMDWFGYPFCKGRVLDRFEKDLQQYDRPSELFWASGAAMMVRAEWFHRLGGFDEDYFAHMEEIDWCWRAKKCGGRIKSVPSVAVYHIGGGTLPYQSVQKVFLNYRNNLATLYKNEPVSKLLILLPARLIMDLAAVLVFVFRKNTNAAAAVCKAYWQFIKWIPALNRKKKAFQSSCKGKRMNTAGRYGGSLVFDFFILGKKTFNSIVHEPA